MRNIVLIVFIILSMGVFSSSDNSSINKLEEQQLNETIHLLRVEAEQLEKTKVIMSIIEAVITIESGGDLLAFNAKEEAVGVLQIRPIMLREVNRLVGYCKYKYDDRWNKTKSIQMFIDYQNHVNPNWNPELAAKKWNGGINGEMKASTTSYWYKVKRVLSKNK